MQEWVKIIQTLGVRKARLESVYLLWKTQFPNLCACTLLLTALPTASVSSQAFPSHPSLNPAPKVLSQVFQRQRQDLSVLTIVTHGKQQPVRVCDTAGTRPFIITIITEARASSRRG